MNKLLSFRLVTAMAFSALFFCTTSCHSQDNSEKKGNTTTGELPVSINGTITKAVNGMVYLERMNDRNLGVKVDSAEISPNKTFSLNFAIPDPGIYQLNVANQQMIGLILEGGEKLTVTADGEMPEQGVPAFKIVGSQTMDKFNAIATESQNFGKQSAVLQEEFQKANEKRKNEIRVSYQQLYDSYRATIIPQIESLGTSLAAIIAANNFLNPETDSEFMVKLADKIKAENKNHYFANLFIQQMARKSGGSVGSMAPDFQLVDLSGKTVKLSELRGKTVIIDFWATWCGPCIMSFPGMKQAMDKYADNPNVKFLFVNTFERVSEDQWKDNVNTFVTRRGFQYLNPVLDIGSQTALSYGVEGIPAKFCIDAEGKIKHKSTGYLGSSDAVFKEMVEWVEGK